MTKSKTNKSLSTSLTSLQEFASQLSIRKGKKCLICSIPERAELDAQRRFDDQVRKNGTREQRQQIISKDDMLAYLIDRKKHDPALITRVRIKSHFDGKHHYQENSSERDSNVKAKKRST